MISVALERGLLVVTQERATGNGKRPHIPDVCNDPSFKADCINVVQLIRREKWVFN